MRLIRCVLTLPLAALILAGCSHPRTAAPQAIPATENPPAVVIAPAAMATSQDASQQSGRGSGFSPATGRAVGMGSGARALKAITSATPSPATASNEFATVPARFIEEADYLQWLKQYEDARLLEGQRMQQMKQAVNHMDMEATLRLMQDETQKWQNFAANFSQRQPPARCAAVADAYQKYLSSVAATTNEAYTRFANDWHTKGTNDPNFVPPSLQGINVYRQQSNDALDQLRAQLPGLPSDLMTFHLGARMMGGS